MPTSLFQDRYLIHDRRYTTLHFPSLTPSFQNSHFRARRMLKIWSGLPPGCHLDSGSEMSTCKYSCKIEERLYGSPNIPQTLNGYSTQGNRHQEARAAMFITSLGKANPTSGCLSAFETKCHLRRRKSFFLSKRLVGRTHSMPYSLDFCCGYYDSEEVRDFYSILCCEMIIDLS